MATAKMDRWRQRLDEHFDGRTHQTGKRQATVEKCSSHYGLPFSVMTTEFNDLATDQWTAVRPRTCRPTCTSPASLMCHHDWDHQSRSSHSDQVIVPSFNLATVARRAFPVFAANLWNILPAHLTSSPSLTIFRQRLETFLFQRSYPDLIIWHLIVDLAVTLLFRLQ